VSAGNRSGGLALAARWILRHFWSRVIPMAIIAASFLLPAILPRANGTITHALSAPIARAPSMTLPWLAGLGWDSGANLRALGILDGGLLALAVTALLSALINRQWLYVLFSAWLLGTLRITAIAMGWDLQWLGHAIPYGWLHTLRKLTVAGYYLLTYLLFTHLFSRDLARTNSLRLRRVCLWMGLALLLAACVLTYDHFMQAMLLPCAFGLAVMAFLLARIVVMTRSRSALWYGLALIVALGAGLARRFAAELGTPGGGGYFPGITAVLAASMLLAQAIAARPRTRRDARRPARRERGNAPASRRFPATATRTPIRLEGHHDPLTHTLNKRGIDSKLGESLRHVSRGRPFSLAYLDLNPLRIVTNIYGHVAGDRVLEQICRRVDTLLRPGQYLGRIGGDEFIVVFSRTPIDQARDICQRILDDLRLTPCQIGTHRFQSQGVMGVVEITAALRAQDAISAAARACRMAGRGDRNRVTVYRHDAREIDEHFQELKLLKDLGNGLPPENLFLAMQPIMSLQDPAGRLDFEVLLRMRNIHGGLIATEKIIAAAEENGMISTLDKWVFRTTLHWLHEHSRNLTRTRFVCINLSGMSLNDETFVGEFFRTLDSYKHLARLLCIEITESVALRNMENTRLFIRRIQARGVRVALDDFGAGYTSFSYLAELPADVIKIDGRFIKSMNEHSSSTAIVETIITLGRNLGMECIAEWVEDLDTLVALRDMGVDYVQGHGIARPMPPATILAAGNIGALIADAGMRNAAFNGC